jgi:hypothetical protein
VRQKFTERTDLGQRVARRLSRLPRSSCRSAQSQRPGLSLWRAITPPLGDSSAGAHPIARGIEQAAGRGGCPRHVETGEHYPSPGDSVQHDNVRRIRSGIAARSARQRGSLDKHSTFTDRTQRSVKAFKFGLRTGSASGSTRPDVMMARNVRSSARPRSKRGCPACCGA